MSDNSKSGGIGFLGMLAILFIGLKLTGTVDWSWWVVLAPLWGQVVLLAVIVIAVLWLKANDKLLSDEYKERMLAEYKDKEQNDGTARRNRDDSPQGTGATLAQG